jgi:hypothetical protein
MGRVRLRGAALNSVRLLAGSAFTARRKGPSRRADEGVECGAVARWLKPPQCCNLPEDCSRGLEPKTSDLGASRKGAGRATPL